MQVSGRSTAWSSVSPWVQGVQVGGHHQALADGSGAVVHVPLARTLWWLGGARHADL
ncbi:hypothetical protein ACIODX_15705 [Streptomyces sp. NPDC088190]|uniref:hypothetical protein n=1 Tax=unclassified Streptomyces TaxID=2593676 RepID=UPI002E764D87|nr:hypothetical protein [Streptomyces sp. JV190]MEE1845188.1 hypothetical protein [Streptomyces sp. JV190]